MCLKQQLAAKQCKKRLTLKKKDQQLHLDKNTIYFSSYKNILFIIVVKENKKERLESIQIKVVTTNLFGIFMIKKTIRVHNKVTCIIKIHSKSLKKILVPRRPS